MWEYFTIDEVLNPYFDDCPQNSWDELPQIIKHNLEYTMALLDFIRDNIQHPIRINSSYRPKSKGSAHSFGKAIDFQFINGEDNLYRKVMTFLQTQNTHSDFRAILEWQGIGLWIHIDRRFRDIDKKTFMIAYPASNTSLPITIRRKEFLPYNGITPKEQFYA